MTTPIVLGTVHGNTVDGHFYETVTNYYQQQIWSEIHRLGDALKEAAGHLEDESLAAKYIEIAGAQAFQMGTVNVRSGPLLSMGRGIQCAAFLDQTEAEWLFVSDTDMTWDHRLPEEMVRIAELGATMADGSHERIQILGGVAWILQMNADGTVQYREPNVYKGVDASNGRVLVKMQEGELPENGLCKVGACGGALMLIHRDALTTVREKMGGLAHWWHHLPSAYPVAEVDGVEQYDQYGEDTSFSLRCHDAGIPVWVHTGIKLGHAKTIVQY